MSIHILQGLLTDTETMISYTFPQPLRQSNVQTFWQRNADPNLTTTVHADVQQQG